MHTSAAISLLQITDLHLLPAPGARLLGVDTAASLDAVLSAALAARSPDAMIVSGDIAHAPVAATYARARQLLSQHYGGPMLWLPGNHDLGAPLVAAGPPVDELRLGDWSIQTLDTHADGVESGCIAPAELRRLRDRLRNSSARYVIVFGHHPALPVGTSWIDSTGIGNGAELLAALEADQRVRAYVCGHVHQANATTHNGIAIFTTPSTCFQFARGTERFSVDTTPPGWRWLELDADGTLRSHVGRADDFVVIPDMSTFKKH
jgi:3',5'-cyclic-AMP phosphodiesterase